MPRTAKPVQPGTNPTPAPDAEDLAKDTLAAGALAAAATAEAEQANVNVAVLHAELAKRDAEMAEMRAMLKALGRNQLATAVPDKVVLPSMKDVMSKKPSIPMLTEEGWYVPDVHPTDRAKAL